MSALSIILVGLTMTLFSEKMLIFHRCICGLMPNLIKKSWPVSLQTVCLLGQTFCPLARSRPSLWHILYPAYYALYNILCLVIYLVIFCKKDFLLSPLIERKGYCFSVISFFYFNSKWYKRLPKKLPIGINSQKWKKNLVKLS